MGRAAWPGRPSGSAAERLADHSVEVELVDALGPDGDASPNRPAVAPVGTGHHVAAWTGLAVSVVLAVVVVGANLAQARRERAVVAALEDVAGVLAPVGGPIEEVWRVPGRQLIADSPDALVLSAGADAADLRAVDPASGVVLWERAGDPRQTCLPVGGDGGEVRSPVLIVCAAVLDADTPGAADATSLVALEPATGREVRVLDVATAPLTLDVVDDDVVITRLGDRETVTATRWDPVAGRVVWTYRTEPGRATGLHDRGWWLSIVERGVLWVGAPRRMVAVDLATGRGLPGEDPPDVWSVGSSAVLPDGSTAFWGDEVGGEPLGTRVVGPDGAERFTFDGAPWLAAVSDGSEPDVLPVRRAGTLDVVGLDVRTGEQVWAARTLQGMYPYVQVDGIAVATNALRTVAVDLGTGTRLWEESLGQGRSWPLTDGRQVFLLTRERGLLGVSAHDVRTGAQQWWVPVPRGAAYLEAAGRDTILVHTGQEVIAYR